VKGDPLFAEMHRESRWNADADQKLILPINSSGAVFMAFFLVH
jgi:hypothetical protein